MLLSNEVPRKPFSPNDEAVLPLINIVFLLLIFFMLAGQMQPATGLMIKPALSQLSAQASQQSLTINLDQHQQIEFEGKIISLQELLTDCDTKRPAKIYIKADQRIAAAKVLQLAQQLQLHHVGQVLLLTQSQQP
jgi:biopolymer transport protein ExbD